MTIAPLLNAAARGTASPDALGLLARTALECGEEAQALPFLRQAAEREASDTATGARLWQWTALLERALDRHDLAMTSFASAARLAPQDAGIAHGLARTTLEAGLGAVALFARARDLAPADPGVVLGMAAAQLAAGEGASAEAMLVTLVEQVPLWIDGHRHLAQLRALLGQPERADESLRRALAANPRAAPLWHGLFELHLAAERYWALADAVADARAVGLPQTNWHDHATIAAAETGDVPRADTLFAAATDRLPVWHIRHLLRQHRLDEAVMAIDAALARGEQAAWPYALTAWRLTDDPRAAWLASPELVQSFDIGDMLPPLETLATALRDIHRAGGTYLDQSVRGGTQTDGPLFSRIDPAIRSTRTAIVAAIDRYVAALPPADPHHPTLGRRRDRGVRFAGSWSVRLSGGGHHANHVHPQGWISSALYVALPDLPSEQGWLTIGEPPSALGIDQPPLRSIAPRPGQLVLFPSWLWHGTRPFADGERMTIAFDVAPPI